MTVHWSKGVWPLNRLKNSENLPFAAFKVRSHQTRMTRIAQMIYMLSQCKDAKDNPAALFARMRRRECRKLSWKIWTLADIRAALTNQELALAVTSLRAEAENPKQQWRTNKSWLYEGTRSCIYIFVLLQKQEYILQPDWSCLAEAPPMTRIRVCCVTLVNFTREWSEFEAKSRVKFTTQQARIRVMGGASARQLQSGCKMYSCFCKSTKMYIQLRVPTYNHDLFVLHCCFGFSASARNDVTARASSWLVNAVRISAKIQIFQLALFMWIACQTLNSRRVIHAIRTVGLSFASLHWLNM